MKYKKYKKSKKKLKVKVRIALLVSILLVLLGLSFWVLYTLDFTKQKEIIYEHEIKKDAIYEVTLKENPHYDDKVLGKSLLYPSAFTDKIKGNLKFSYKGSETIDIIYDHSLKLELRGEYKATNEEASSKIWDKSWIIKESEKSAVNASKVFEINEDFEIDYNFYDKEASEYKKNIKIPAEINLFLTMEINLKKYLEGEIINEQQKVEISFPLTQETFRISENFDKKEEKVDKFKYHDSDFYSKKRFSLLIALLPLEIYFIVIIIIDFKKVYATNNYGKKLKKILKEYGDVIVEVNNSAMEVGLDVIFVKNFKEMLDLQDELRIPILFYETKEGLEGEFTLVHGDIIYKLILDNKE